MAESRQRNSGPAPRGRPINAPLQQLHIAHKFPTFTRLREVGTAIWRGTLQPRESSPVYQVTISVRLRVGAIPKVRVITPQLAPNAPHLYSDGTLCLYWPQEWRWRETAIIADTILPWTALWLYYYELWLDCGEWLGPSSHQPTSS
jgi:hypothetical protein